MKNKESPPTWTQEAYQVLHLLPWGGVPPLGRGNPPQPGPTGGYPPGQVRWGYLRWGTPPTRTWLGYCSPPPRCGQTDMCQNITYPVVLRTRSVIIVENFFAEYINLNHPPTLRFKCLQLLKIKCSLSKKITPVSHIAFVCVHTTNY